MGKGLFWYVKEMVRFQNVQKTLVNSPNIKDLANLFLGSVPLNSLRSSVFHQCYSVQQKRVILKKLVKFIANFIQIAQWAKTRFWLGGGIGLSKFILADGQIVAPGAKFREPRALGLRKRR